MKRGNQRKFGRDRKVRTAMYKSLATALIDHGQIKTTQAKAKSLSQVVEKLITLAKRKNLNAHRELLGHVGEKATKKLMNEIATSNADRKGGYTRIIRLGQRPSDGAEMALIEFTDFVTTAK
ncbi:MAG: 50S ribosomal protein L17 [Candidatus Pacebacteria bacterium]|nr:50S ribosomal protein L17 [Candidatus Paceibacterota bacterium]